MKEGFMRLCLSKVRGVMDLITVRWSDWLVFQKLVIKSGCLGIGRGIKFSLDSTAADFVPAESPVFLPESTIAAHQPSVGILAAGVLSEYFLAQTDACRIPFFFKVVSTQSIQNDEVAILQALPLEDGPILV